MDKNLHADLPLSAFQINVVNKKSGLKKANLQLYLFLLLYFYLITTF